MNGSRRAQRGVRIPPQNLEAEQSVLGAILIDRDAITAVAEFLKPEHFYKEAHGAIFAAMLQLYEKREPVDLVTLAQELKEAGKFDDIGGAEYLAELANFVPTAANITYYGQIVRDHHTKRKLITIAGKITDAAFDTVGDTSELMDLAEKSIFGVSQAYQKQFFTHLKDALAESIERLDEIASAGPGFRGIPSGLADLDNILGGFQPSNLIIMASRPGQGKSALALNFATFMGVHEKIPVGLFSLEMSKEEVVDRLLVSHSRVDAWRLKTGRLEEEDFSKLQDAMGLLAEAPIFIDDTPAASVMEIRTKARRLEIEQGLRFLIVDYLQLVRGRQLENRVQEVSEISQFLKNLARELKIPVLAISQLSRAVEQRGSRRPQLADLRECLAGDTIVFDADTAKPFTLQELYETGEKIKLLALADDGKLESMPAEPVTNSGLRDVFRLETRSGKEIIASANHPFLTPRGWMKLESLKPSDLIAVPRSLDFNPKQQKITPELARFLGYLVSDGTYIKYRTCGFTNSDKEVAADAIKIAKKNFGVRAHIDNHNNSINIDFVTTYGKWGRPGGNKLINWLKEIGIYGQGTAEKEVAKVVFESSNTAIAEFLRGAFTGDGTIVHRKNGRWNIKYASKNKNLILQMQHLLLRLGISATIRQGRKGKFEIFYLDIDSKDQMLAFIEKVNFCGRKQKIAEQAKKELQKRGTNPGRNLYPLELTDYVKQKKEEKGLSWRQLGYRCQGKRMGRFYLQKVAEKLDDSYLKQLATSDYDWEEIKSINPKGREVTYDILVPGHHNFVANDIIVHNSGALEQDADVVMFLYREDADDIENVILDVQKHRNGRLGQVRLTFRPELISFFGTAKV